MSLRIMSIDGSLKNSGLCVADLNFYEEYKEDLFALMLGEKVAGEFFDKSFNTIYLDDTGIEKENEKNLAKTRKNQRESLKNGEHPSYFDCRGEINLFTNKILYQVESIAQVIDIHHPLLVFIEDYSYGTQGSSIAQLAEFKGALRITLDSLLCDGELDMYQFVPIGSCKKVGARNGSATKDLVCMEMAKYGRVFDPTKQNDIADAYCLTISIFLSLFHRLYPFDFESRIKGVKYKEKQNLRKFRESLEIIANRIGTKKEITECLIS
jgi:Holliday junction resolvasome RuvABC endonuclease subunit